MHLCLRVDLDYVPWDTPDAETFGHGEPATLLRLLDLARKRDWRLQFYASNRVLHAFPTTAKAVLADGHHLDWLCKHPEQMNGRYDEARRLFAEIGQEPLGLAVREPWPTDQSLPEGLKFLSAPTGSYAPAGKLFSLRTVPDREAFRAGMSVQAWAKASKELLRDSAKAGEVATVCVRPQVLALFDHRLRHVSELMCFAAAEGLNLATHRDLAES
jgi:hypothetical protein